MLHRLLALLHALCLHDASLLLLEEMPEGGEAPCSEPPRSPHYDLPMPPTNTHVETDTDADSDTFGDADADSRLACPTPVTGAWDDDIDAQQQSDTNKEVCRPLKPSTPFLSSRMRFARGSWLLACCWADRCLSVVARSASTR